MSETIQNRFLKRAATDDLHNLYLVEGNRADQDYEILAWINQLLTKHISSTGSKTGPENHQDIAFITPDEKKKNYTSISVEEIFKFLNYNAIELKRKFLIITNAEKLTDSSANKLLKTFEEPPIPLTIFLLNPFLSEVIPTISSRCIKLKLPLDTNKELISEIEWPLTFSDFANMLTTGEKSLEEVSRIIFAKSETSNLEYSKLAQIQSDLKSLEQDILYNGTMQGKAYRLYSCLEELYKN